MRSAGQSKVGPQLPVKHRQSRRAYVRGQRRWRGGNEERPWPPDGKENFDVNFYVWNLTSGLFRGPRSSRATLLWGQQILADCV